MKEKVKQEEEIIDAEIIKEELGITVFECRWIHEDEIEIIFE